MRTIYGSVVVNGVKTKKRMDLENRKCEVCGNEYEPYTQDARCCSKKCYRKDEYRRKRETFLEQRKEYYLKNKDKVLARERQKYQDPQRREEIKVKHKEYYQKNREWYLDAVREDLDNRKHGGKRRELIEKHGYVCYLCGKEHPRIAAHHMINKNDHEHQILLCPSCHAKHHAILRWSLKKGGK